MSTFTTRNGLTVTCDSPGCCTSPTAGGIAADEEERWFDALVEAVEDYLHVYVEHRDCARADEPVLAERLHAAKSDVIARFYAAGWDR